MKKTEAFFESIMFRSRWLLAPFFFGLVIAIVAMLVKFGKQLMTLLLAIFGAGEPPMSSSRP